MRFNEVEVGMLLTYQHREVWPDGRIIRNESPALVIGKPHHDFVCEILTKTGVVTVGVSNLFDYYIK